LEQFVIVQFLTAHDFQFPALKVFKIKLKLNIYYHMVSSKQRIEIVFLALFQRQTVNQTLCEQTGTKISLPKKAFLTFTTNGFCRTIILAHSRNYGAQIKRIF
jgi:hypothetical protein